MSDTNDIGNGNGYIGRRLDLDGGSGGASHSGARVRVRTLIADDAPAVRAGVKALLSQDTEVEVIGEAGSGPEALALIRRLRPDLVLLDAQMPEMGGLEVAARLARECLPAVVFLSSYDREALDALRAHRLDYLLKPFEEDRFFEALRRAKVQLWLARTLDQGERALAAYRAVSGGAEPRPLLAEPAAPFQDSVHLPHLGGGGPPGYLARLAIRDTGRTVLVDVNEIDWIEAADYYVQIHVGPKAYLHRETMQRLESELDPVRFVRIHRSAIVNQSRIRELRHHGRRDLVVVLSGGAELRVARSHREKLQGTR